MERVNEEELNETESNDTSIAPLPRLYFDVNYQRTAEHWDYENYRIEWSVPYSYEVIRRVGRGKYSDVFEGIDIQKNEFCIIKVLKPVRQKKINKEIKVLRNLQGGPNIVNLLDVVKDPDTRTRSLIFEHINNKDFKTFYPTLTDLEIRYYIYQILKALDYCHSQGIMHRDVKPHNVMIDHSKGELRLIDWGLSEFYYPHCKYNVRVASRFYKGPELLVNLRSYHYSLDTWSLGCMLASMIFMKEPFFYEQGNTYQLLTIADILGTEDLFQYLAKYKIILDYGLQKRLRRRQRRSWNSFVNEENKHLCTAEAIDLVDKMLVYDHNTRPLPKELMSHPYFSPIMINGEAQLISSTSPKGISLPTK
ncbi:uncharacterized protein LOC128882536 [Hylaeus volcanicus]|uniref:uncharacterized protein LOC128882536 n=1 Tax=Hylaeus volcanicus TaxID=313075 RepID=UPI0023B86393|nr:uncharacterized protein LOC128882536 [Hylaeus volcanicus]XP_053990133.1 uncharacterized protein LOC128882536 [Hylaeus volcanicus]XP_053990134.1 uncharacterized protein LOC128882536 [Hylaeus volcanicus]